MKRKLLQKQSLEKNLKLIILAIPAVVFSDPELATVGYTEEQAKDEGIEVSAGKFPYAGKWSCLIT